MRAAYENTADFLTDLQVSASERPARTAFVLLGAVALVAAAFMLLRGGADGATERGKTEAGFSACAQGYCLKGTEAPKICAVGKLCQVRIEGSRPATTQPLRVELGASLVSQLKTTSTGTSWVAEGPFRCLTAAPAMPVSVQVGGGPRPALLTARATVECSAAPPPAAPAS